VPALTVPVQEPSAVTDGEYVVLARAPDRIQRPGGLRLHLLPGRAVPMKDRVRRHQGPRSHREYVVGPTTPDPTETEVRVHRAFRPGRSVPMDDDVFGDREDIVWGASPDGRQRGENQGLCHGR